MREEGKVEGGVHEHCRLPHYLHRSLLKPSESTPIRSRPLTSLTRERRRHRSDTFAPCGRDNQRATHLPFRQVAPPPRKRPTPEISVQLWESERNCHQLRTGGKESEREEKGRFKGWFERTQRREVVQTLSTEPLRTSKVDGEAGPRSRGSCAWLSITLDW